MIASSKEACIILVFLILVPLQLLIDALINGINSSKIILVRKYTSSDSEMFNEYGRMSALSMKWKQ